MSETTKGLLQDFLPQLKSLIQSETVFGEPYSVADVTIIPVNSVRIGFGFGNGEVGKDVSKSGGGGGGGVVLTPQAFLVVKKGEVSIHTLTSGSLENIMDRVPGLIDGLASVFDRVMKKKPSEPPKEA